MESKERDEKGRFKKGVMPKGAVPFTAGTAKEMALRSQALQAERKTLRETLLAELERKARAGEPMTKMEYLVAKAIENHAKGALTFRDLTALADLLGEKEITINHRGPLVITDKEAEALDKWTGK